MIIPYYKKSINPSNEKKLSKVVKELKKQGIEAQYHNFFVDNITMEVNNINCSIDFHRAINEEIDVEKFINFYYRLLYLSPKVRDILRNPSIREPRNEDEKIIYKMIDNCSIASIKNQLFCQEIKRRFEDIPFDKKAKLDSERLLAALKQEFGDQLHVHQSASHPDSYKVRLHIEDRIIKMTLCQKFCQICLGGTINIPLTGMSVETFSHFIRHFFDDYDELDRQWTEKITDASKEITLRNIKANIVSAQLEGPLEALHHTVQPKFTKMLLSVSLSPNNDLKFYLPYDVEKSVIDSIADFVNDTKAFQDELNAKVDVYGAYR